jgi:hypothetical protein
MSRVPVPLAPRADDFRALAQSSPWRFITVHFTYQGQRGAGAEADGIAEAWLDRRAHRVTVRSPDGVRVAEGVPYGVSGMDTTTALRTPIEATLRPDGLVAKRPSDWHLYYGDPMWRDYQWTAMLDPAELSSGVQIDGVTATTLRGRPTWSATCRPLMGDGEEWEGGYDPRCGCCPLLESAASRLLEYGPDDPTLHSGDLPTTYLVHLDVQTAIAVQIDAVDGRGGAILSNKIHDVDQPLSPPRTQPV